MLNWDYANVEIMNDIQNFLTLHNVLSNYFKDLEGQQNRAAVFGIFLTNLYLKFLENLIVLKHPKVFEFYNVPIIIKL